MARKPELLVGLDIGTAKVAAVVAEPAAGTGVSVVGAGAAPCEGLRKGVVVNIEATVQALASAIREAEVSAGCEIHSVFVSLNGAHAKAFNSHGAVPVKTREVARSDVERVLDAARAVALPMDRDIVHVLPQEFIIDGQDGIRAPLGMSGVRLEARVHVVTSAIAAAQNVLKCCQRTGLHVSDLILAPLAAAEAVLTPEEKELGAALIDIGAGTTGIVAFDQGAVKHTAVLSIGGNHVSSDIAAGLRTPFREAERLKRRHGCALALAVSADETIEVPALAGHDPRKLSRHILAEIIEPRIEEILALAQRQLIRSGLDEAFSSGIVLTGGTVLLEGVAALAERVFGQPVRIGAPIECEGLDETLPGPAYAGAIGLARYGAQPPDHPPAGLDDGRLLGRVKRRMVNWIKELM
jgi:cell division protein FtsA